VFLFSDFLDIDYQEPVRRIGRRHDAISIHISDPWEQELPRAGMLQLHDAETGDIAVINTASARLRARFAQHAVSRQTALRRFFKARGLDLLELNTAQPYVDPLITFFRQRAARMR